MSLKIDFIKKEEKQKKKKMAEDFFKKVFYYDYTLFMKDSDGIPSFFTYGYIDDDGKEFLWQSSMASYNYEDFEEVIVRNCDKYIINEEEKFIVVW